MCMVGCDLQPPSLAHSPLLVPSTPGIEGTHSAKSPVLIGLGIVVVFYVIAALHQQGPQISELNELGFPR